MTYKNYQEYLSHPRFRAVRKQAINAAGGFCVDCKQKNATEVHHIKYPPWGTFDTVENLAPLCHDCHCVRHGKES